MNSASDITEHEMALIFHNELNIGDPFEAIPTVNIAINGDILMLVGEGGNQLNLRVLSAKLISASKVFEAMFSQNFNEGQALASNNADAGNAARRPLEIPFPEDDPEAMRMILEVWHSDRNGWHLEPISFTTNEYAEMIDKYLLQDTLLPATDVSFTEFLGSGGKRSERILQWLHIALIREDTKAFEIVTEHLLLHYPPSYYEYLLQDSKLDKAQSFLLQLHLSRAAESARRELKANVDFYFKTIMKAPHGSQDMAQRFGRDWKETDVESNLCGHTFHIRQMHGSTLSSLLQAHANLPSLPVPQNNRSLVIDPMVGEFRSVNSRIPMSLPHRDPGLCLMCFRSQEASRSPYCQQHAWPAHILNYVYKEYK